MQDALTRLGIGLALALLTFTGALAAPPTSAQLPAWIQAMEAADPDKLHKVLAAHPELIRSDAKGTRQVGTQLLSTFIITGKNVEVLKALVDAGVPIQTKNPDVMPPIVAAVVAQRDDVVRFCVERRANVNVFYQGLTPLHFAVISGQGKDAKADERGAAVVKTLLAAGANPDLRAQLKSAPAKGNAAAPTARDMVRVLDNSPKVRGAVGP